MRLWHKDLIPHLPRAQLLGQHRECCAMRGKGWGKPHRTVNYVWNHPYSWLFHYHEKVMDEMKRRDYHVSPEWRVYQYRGKRLGLEDNMPWHTTSDYPEHDDEYLQECLANLAAKGHTIKIGEVYGNESKS